MKATWLLIASLVIALAHAIYLSVYRLQHPDMTETRVLLETWRSMLPGFLVALSCLVSFYWATSREDRR